MAVEKLVGIRDIAEWTGLPISWIYVNAAKSKIPCYKLGKYVKFRFSEVEQWIQQQRQGPTAQ
jgi:excisionase family DNA binding protein